MRQRPGSASLLRAAAAFSLGAVALIWGQVPPEEYYQNELRKHASHYAECLQGKTPDNAHSVNVTLVLDASGPTKASMAGGVTLDVLRSAALRFAAMLPSTVNVAVLVYGHQGDMTVAGKELSCKAVSLVFPSGPYRAKVVTPLLEPLQPGGWTPLRAAIEKSGDSFAGVSDLFKNNIIYLLAAGMDTCGGNPIQVARLVHTERDRTTIHVISVATSSAEQEELRAVAAAGGGRFTAARSAADLRQFFDAQAKSLRETFLQNVLSPACIETRLAAERSAIEHDLQVDSTGTQATIDATTVKFAKDRLQQRQDKIRTWMQGLGGRRGLTPEVIEKELSAVQ